MPSFFYGVFLDINNRSAVWGNFRVSGLDPLFTSAFLPTGFAARWSANRTTDSRLCYELLQRGYVIPQNAGYHDFIRPIQQVTERDRGGMIISPRIGDVHENVAELDYESQYPNLIIKEGLSFETVTPDGISETHKGILPAITKKALSRRLHFKGLRKNLAIESDDWRWAEQRQIALKFILVCIYCTLGSCWNRFGNVLTFEEINLKSRETMIETKNIAQSEGFQILYGDTDSIFVKSEGATEEVYMKLAALLTEKTRLPISLTHHYKFLLLLPLEADPSGIMEAQKHYFGKLTNGEILTRGIEVRRHDSPRFIKDFQLGLITTLFNHESAGAVKSKGYETAQDFVAHCLDDLMEGKIPLEDLVVSGILRRYLTSYKSIFPHVSAAIQLASQGKSIKPGDTIDFIHTDAKHHNPLRRVAPYDSPDGRIHEDRDKYREMILDAAETVLSTFGFSREVYGFQKKFNNWIDELWEERRREMGMEASTEE